MNGHRQQGYIIEYMQVGNALKVSAMDPSTLVEVSIVAPTSGASRDEIERVVIQKLKKAITTKQNHDMLF